MNLDIVDHIVDLRGVRGGEAGLLADAGGDDGLEQEVGVDDGDAAEGGLGGVLPVVVGDDEHLEGRRGDGHLEQRAGLVLVGAVGVGEQGAERDVDGLDAGVDDGDEAVVLGGVRVLVEEGLVRDVDVEGGLVGDEVVDDVGLVLLVLEQDGASVGHGGLEALDVLDAAVEGEGGGPDLDDLARGALIGAVLVLGGDLDLAEGEGLDADEAFGEGLADLVEALFIEPEVEGVAGHELEGDVVAPRALFHVARGLFEGVELDDRAVLLGVHEFRQPRRLDALLVLLVRRGAPSGGERTDDREARGDLLVPAVGVALEGDGVVVDGEELGVLAVVDVGDVARACLGFEVEHCFRLVVFFCAMWYRL